MKRPLRALWGMPILLGLLSAAGLAGALVGEGVWDDVAVLALAAPVAAGAWYAVRRVSGTKS